VLKHHHQWQFSDVLLLSLPDVQGTADVLMAWHCATCPEELTIDGHIPVGSPVSPPAHWLALHAAEQRSGTPEARQATQQQRRGRGSRY
jgi:hypothetical protein